MTEPHRNTYALIYTYTDDAELREATRPAHREYLDNLGGATTLLVAGAWLPDEPPGGLLIFRAADKAAVQAVADADPYTTAGVVAESLVRAWAPPLGPLAREFTE